MFFRKFYKFSNQETSLKLYKSLTRRHLEYASTVWSPHLAKDIKTVEDVQKFAGEFVVKIGNINYESLFVECNLDSMATLRTFARICLLFKII